MSQENRICIITGAAQGIGLACARRFCDDGYTVVLADVQADVGEASAESLRANGGKAEFVTCDVGSKADVDALVDGAVSKYGRIDVFIANAAILHTATILELEEEDFDRVVRVNLKGFYLCGKAAATQMAKQGSGAIINMSSIQAEITNPNLFTYAACKGGVRQMTIAMSLALADKGVRVNAIGPGSIATAMVEKIAADPAVRKTIMSRTPMGRLGRPEEIASVAAFLASEDASYITGQTINVDGGRMGLNYTVPVAD
jgi:NAD(P)-dependent dehydrogenase (short-subunit alcohol dehydrogenase family)